MASLPIVRDSLECEVKSGSHVHISLPPSLPDLFAIPDFAAGAMENWGLITYRETALLFDETTGPLASKERVTLVIAHELAHQVLFVLCVVSLGSVLC